LVVLTEPLRNSGTAPIRLSSTAGAARIEEVRSWCAPSRPASGCCFGCYKGGRADGDQRFGSRSLRRQVRRGEGFRRLRYHQPSRDRIHPLRAVNEIDEEYRGIQLEILDDTVFNGMGQFKIHNHNHSLVTFAGGILSGPLLLWTGIRPVWFCHNTVIPASNTCHFRSSPRLGPEVSVRPEARREVGPQARWNRTDVFLVIREVSFFRRASDQAKSRPEPLGRYLNTVRTSRRRKYLEMRAGSGM
jgi:hypothetical protein